MANLNLDPILAKLCEPTRGLGWEKSRALRATEQYRRWLWLNAVYGADHLSPSRDVDQVWHTHILDTRKYLEDCAAMFNGRFLHHNPYSGWESEAAESAHQSDYRRTAELYAKHFGDIPQDEASGQSENLCVSALGSGDSSDVGLCISSYDQNERIWRPNLAA
jgi:hypothetical protein